jgi:hypothetical protein
MFKAALSRKHQQSGADPCYLHRIAFDDRLLTVSSGENELEALRETTR